MYRHNIYKVASILAVWLIGVSNGDLLAQVPSFSSTHYNSENIGISHNTVTNMITDTYGFVWVSTMDGLNRFDGKSVKIFQNSPDDSTTISDSFIHGVFEHRSGKFIIGTRDGGLNIFDPITETIERLNSKISTGYNIPNAPVNVIHEDSKGFLWVGFFTNTIGHFDFNSRRFYSTNLIERTSGERIHSTNSILELKDGSFILTTLHGLYYLSSEQVEKFRNSPSSGQKIIADQIIYTRENPKPNTNHLFLDAEHTLWVNVVTDDLRPLQTELLASNIKQSIASGVASSSTNKIILERGDYLIIGHENGFIRVIHKQTNTDQLIKVVNTENTVGATTIYEDKLGNIWLYTWGDGFYHLKERKGIKLVTNSIGNETLPSPFILAFEADAEGVWVGTNQGLVYYDNDGKATKIPTRINSQLGSIWALEQDGNDLWVATRTKGLALIKDSANNKQALQLRSFTIQNSLVANNNVHQVLKDSRGWLWLGYQGEGIQIIKNPNEWINGQAANIQLLKNDGAEKSLNSNSIRKLYEDNAGNIWVATTDNGINYVTVIGENISSVQVFESNSTSNFQLSHKDARGVYQQQDSTYWFASYGGGITKYELGSNELLNLRTTEGLPNNSVYGILGDENPDYIWMSTNSGIGRLNTKDLTFTTFTENDGLQNSEFNTGAYFKNTDGLLYFGGINGFNIIDTDELAVNTNPPEVYLTKINLFNEEYEHETSPLFIDQLTLSYNQNFLSFEFAALDYEEPKSNSYIYKMVGIDSEWVEAGNRNFADYPNLKPGSYTFKVKASNKYGIWNEDGISLSMKVLPPWWKTWWFRALYITFIVGAFTALIQYYSQKKLKEQIRKMEIKNRLRNERERISRDLHDHVGAQLANIITGLSLVDKYTEVNEKEKSISLMKSLKGDAEVTIKQLRETIWALNQNEITIDGFVNHLSSYFKNQSALNDQLTLQISNDGDNRTILSAAQALNLFRIIQEASQNTLKYAEAEHLVIHLSNKAEQLQVTVKDDGVFKADKESFNGGYGMKNMHKRAKEINGTVEVNTEGGTEITVLFPLDR